MSREIMQQALSAFEEIMFTKNVGSSHIIAKNARYALREELAKPEQEPVAYKYTDKTNPLVFYFTERKGKDVTQNLYVIETALYTAPPRKEWVGLDDEDWMNVPDFQKEGCELDAAIYDWIEARLKEKNT